ncbi:MAG: hypothetical protein AAGB46_03325 [Verrucomicrobiota bacterium]
MKAYRLTFDDFVELQNLHLGKKRWILQWASTGIAVAALGRSLWLGPEEYPILQALIFAAILLVCGWVFAPWMQMNRYKKAFAAQERIEEETQIFWDVERVEWKTEGGSVAFSWNDVIEKKVGKNVALLYESPLSMRPVPLRVFEDEDEQARFFAMVTGKVV